MDDPPGILLPTLRIIRAILLEDFSGSDVLNCTEIAVLLNLDQVQARHVVSELDAIGLVQFVPDEGAVLKPFGAQDLLEIFHIRGVLVVEATRLASRHIPTDLLMGLRDFCMELIESTGGASQKPQEIVDCDRRLYELVARFCGTHLLFSEMARFDKLMQVVRDIRRERGAGLMEGLFENRRVLDSLLVPDENTAVAAMAEHLRKIARRDIEAVYGSGAREVILEAASTVAL
ncbi:MAG TPA: FCD domain-containing protein [Tepidisphaeraceae bacterium]|jgi:DNA-binding GntR family transcriptional regulator|nr:FCD domain-containing protein [Tepidisphaeraceae bacterium]